VKKITTQISTAFQFLSHFIPGVTTTSEDGVIFWRQKILFYLSFALLYFSIPVLILSIIAAIVEDLYMVAILNTILYIVFAFIITSRKLKYEVKSFCISSVFYVIGVYILIYVGPYGAGLVWLFAFPVFAGLLLGLQIAYIALSLNFFTVILLVLGLKYGLFKSYFFGFYNPTGWIAVSINFILINLAVTVTLSILLEGIKKRMWKEVQIRENITLAKNRAELSDKQKSSFLADMSHEIRSPMNAILGFSELLRSEDLTREKQEIYFNIIHEKGRYLLQLINDIIDISRIESNQILLEEEVCNLNEIMEELFSTFSGELQSKQVDNVSLKMNNEFTKPSCYVYIDPVRFRQIMINLISNAIKFTKNGFIEFGYLRNNTDFLTFYVKDTGVGMTKEAKARIFNRFEQVKENHLKKFEGAGLGLYITKNLVDLMEGRIWVDSEPNKGSCFYFQIPYHPAPLN
jgi:signal transduction histidine kinase